MLSPFPCMDPYLESPDVWPDFHFQLIDTIRAQLAPRVRPRFLVYASERVYITYEDTEPLRRISPDVAIEQRDASETLSTSETAVAVAEPVSAVVLLEETHREYFLEIRRKDDEQLITSIEVLSPTNKRPGSRGTEEYLNKRGVLRRSETNLVEIDLLRGGERVPVRLDESVQPYEYLAIVDRAPHRSICDAFPIRLRDSLPVLPIPLLQGEPESYLDVQQAFQEAYERGLFADKVDYTAPLDPPLSEELAKWVQSILENARGAAANG